MRFDESVQSVKQKLKANTMLVSNATLAILTALRTRSGSNSATFIKNDCFYDGAVDALNKELLGYEKSEWSSDIKFRRCNIRTAQIIDNTIHYIPNPLSDTCFHMLWGSQQVEAFLSEVMDLTVFESGNQELIDQEISRLETEKPLFHTETGVANVWAVFTGEEMLRLYLQLNAAVMGVCDAIAGYESSEIPGIQITTNVTVSF